MIQTYTYKIFYASIDPTTGQMWCSDCRRADGILSRVFHPESGLKSEIIRVGDKPSWKDLNNQYRQAPWHVTGIPTVVKVDEQGNEVARAEEDVILDGEALAKFLKD